MRARGGLVLFPEMDEQRRCAGDHHGVLGHSAQTPASVMCATSRMVVKRQGETRPDGDALHAAALRAGIRDGRNRWPRRRRTMAACSTTAR